MRAMVFAAGLGTRLRPLTNDRPKALIQIGGRALVEITLGRLREFGIREVVINAHHFADKLADYLKAHDNFGMRIEISHEEVLLDTGGGLKKAAHFFLAGARDVKAGGGSEASSNVTSGANSGANFDEPIVVHNVDVISRIDLARMAEVHSASQALATLAVQDRESARHLIFDEQLQLCGRRIEREAPTEIARNPTTDIVSNARSETVKDATTEVVRKARRTQALAFAGIHIISPRFLTMLTEEGAFSIIASYLRLAGQGEKILGFRADEYYWRDVGRHEDLEQAERELRMP